MWVGLAAAVAGWILIQIPFWRHVELKVFDFLVVNTTPAQFNLPITIVGIDEETFSALKTTWPLPRRYHASVLDNLKAAGVAAVGFDIVFSDPSDPKDDQLFAEAIERFGNVVLASDLAFREDSTVRQWFRVDPHPAFLKAGATPGYASLEVDGDAVLRRVPTVGDAFARAMLREFARTHPGISANVEVSEDMRIRYVGGPHTVTYVPYHYLLDPQQYLPHPWKVFFNDNIVLVGRKSNVIHDVGASQAEMYQTPFFYKTREFMPRVEVHANLVANMVTGEVLREAPRLWAMWAWFAAALGGVVLMRRWDPVRSGAVLLMLVGTVLAVQYITFVREGLWFPAVGAIATVALVYLAQGALAFVLEQRQRRELRGAFSMYVSPALVDELIAHPERLKLGGDRRPMTILFSDLAGFTSISEHNDPEVVSRFVNRHLSGMTETILGHKGTVQKFLGDGVMAFWGAPLADPLQSEHAVRAAVEMQQKVETLADYVAGDLGVRVSMRIGINCGECIVGNMGGDNRFDYTAVGDAVNLAARLEGVNKVYGTRIIVSEAIVAAVGSRIKFREIDTVMVMGKTVGISIFTPCEDEALIELSAEALAAYRAGEFEEAEALWHNLLARYADDPVATVFLERIANFPAGPPAGWDGVTTLDSK